MFLAPKAFLVGLFRGLTSPKSVLLLFLANLLVASLVSVPIYKLASDQLGSSPDTRAFLTAYDQAFVDDLQRNHASTFDAAASTARVATVIGFLLNIFLLVLGMMLLTAVVWFVLYARRIPAMQRAGKSAQEYTTPDKGAALLPEEVSYPSNNFKNLFELCAGCGDTFT